ncbi:MAG: glycosyltransferase WbuB, partial [Fimbriimonadaceae bacterium]
MRILVHDYAGHPFPIELSRALAHRGHEVLHFYSASNNNPQGSLARKEGDAAGYLPTPITLKEPIQKGALLKRRRQEVEHGRKVIKKLEEFRPEVVLSGNTPLDPQRLIQVASRRAGAKFVYWVQDLVGVATRLLLRDRMRVAGNAIGGYYERLEQRLLQNSDALVLI